MPKRRLTTLHTDTSKTREDIAYSTSIKGSEEHRKQLEREHTWLRPFRQENDQQTSNQFSKLRSQVEDSFIWLWQNKHYAELIGRTKEQFLNECSKIYGQTTHIQERFNQSDSQTPDSKTEQDYLYQYEQCDRQLKHIRDELNQAKDQPEKFSALIKQNVINRGEAIRDLEKKLSREQKVGQVVQYIAKVLNKFQKQLEDSDPIFNAAKSVNLSYDLELKQLNMHFELVCKCYERAISSLKAVQSMRTPFEHYLIFNDLNGPNRIKKSFNNIETVLSDYNSFSEMITHKLKEKITDPKNSSEAINAYRYQNTTLRYKRCISLFGGNFDGLIEYNDIEKYYNNIKILKQKIDNSNIINDLSVVMGTKENIIVEGLNYLQQKPSDLMQNFRFNKEIKKLMEEQKILKVAQAKDQRSLILLNRLGQSQEDSTPVPEESRQQILEYCTRSSDEHQQLLKEFNKKIDSISENLEKSLTVLKGTIATFQSRLTDLKNIHKSFMSKSDKPEKSVEEHLQGLNEIYEQCEKRYDEVLSDLKAWKSYIKKHPHFILFTNEVNKKVKRKLNDFTSDRYPKKANIETWGAEQAFEIFYQSIASFPKFASDGTREISNSLRDEKNLINSDEDAKAAFS